MISTISKSFCEGRAHWAEGELLAKHPSGSRTEKSMMLLFGNIESDNQMMLRTSNIGS